MCGRFALIATAEELAYEFEILDVAPFLPKRYNIAPTQNAPVIRVAESRRQIASMRWSFVPSWTDEPKPGPPLINARSETVATSPAFRAAYRRRRCIVPCSGFFEWQAAERRSDQPPKAAKPEERPATMLFPELDPQLPAKKPRIAKSKKQPFFIHPSAGAFLALAGIWECNESRNGEIAESFAILTTTPNRVMAAVHDRMPVILGREDYSRWLDPAMEDPAQLRDLLRPCADERLALRAVSDQVNRVGNDNPECIAPL